MRNLLISFLIWLPTIANSQVADVVKDIDGIISINADKYVSANNWKKRSYYTGKGIQQDSINNGISYVEYKIQIDKPKNYALYLLTTSLAKEKSIGQFGVTAKQRHENDYKEVVTKYSNKNHLDVEVKTVHGDVLSHQKILFNKHISPQSWSNKIIDGHKAAIAFPEKGEYVLRVSSPLSTKCYLEKIVLSSKEDYTPSGTGPTSTLLSTNKIYTSGLDSMVVLPPHWAFGVLYGGYTNQQESIELVDRLVKEDYPIDAYWIDSWFWNYSDKGRGPKGYMNFTEDKDGYPHVESMWNHFENLKIKGGIWLWDCILREGNEDVYDEFKKQGFFRNRFIESNRWHNKTGETICGNIDFENPKAVEHWKNRLKPFFEKGLDFVKLDRSSEIPYTKAAFEATQQLGKETKGRGFVLAHLHTTYDPRHKLYPTKWTGDAKIAWTQPEYPDLSVYAMGAYKENIGMIADPKRSTYEPPFLTHDAGGYDYFKSNEASDELYVRWIQFASMNSIMTLFSQHYNETRNHPYNYKPEIQSIFKKYTQLRMRLFPYIYTYALNTRLEGEKMVKGDGVNEYQYLFGNELLIAPVYEKGVTERTVFLPKGKWYDFETGKEYVGGKQTKVNAPLEKLPMFAREGAIIPMRDYARSIELGTNSKLTLQVFPTKSESTFILREDDGLSNDYLKGGFTSTKILFDGSKKELIISPIEGEFEGMLQNRQWVIEFKSHSRPKNVFVNNIPVDYTYDNKQKQLSISTQQETNKKITILIK